MKKLNVKEVKQLAKKANQPGGSGEKGGFFTSDPVYPWTISSNTRQDQHIPIIAPCPRNFRI